MKQPKHFLIVQGYPKSTRQKYLEIGMTVARYLYANQLTKILPEASYDVISPYDDGTVLPSKEALGKYVGVMWTGASCSVTEKDNPRVLRMIEFAKLIYEVGIPSYGTCFGLHIAVAAAGGKVEKNPKGRELGLARKIQLTEKGKNHPMFDGKPTVFDGFSSHDDHVTELPKGADLLAANTFNGVHAVSITHKKGTFWALQYHPEYNFKEVAYMFLSEADVEIEMGFYNSYEEVKEVFENMKALHKDPQRKDLRWLFGADDDVLSEEIRECEVRNWIEKLVLPNIKESSSKKLKLVSAL